MTNLYKIKLNSGINIRNALLTRQNSYSSSPEWLEKADRTSSHPLEVIGSKQGYALKWCKPNNNDDDDDKLTTLCKTLFITVATTALSLDSQPLLH